jgi:hypothetical protein
MRCFRISKKRCADSNLNSGVRHCLYLAFPSFPFRLIIRHKIDYE